MPALIRRLSAVSAMASLGIVLHSRPSGLQDVAVGDVTKVTDIMATKGTLEACDTDGKRVQ